MDQGDGTFAPIPPVLAETFEKLLHTSDVMTAEDMATLWPRMFVTESEIEIRKSRFRIEYVGTDVLVLKLLPSQP